MSVLKFLSLNVRGLRNQEKRRSVFAYLKSQKAKVYFFKKLFQTLEMRRFGRRNGVVKFSIHMDQIIPRVCVSLLNRTPQFMQM